MVSKVIKKSVNIDRVTKPDTLTGPLYELENEGHTFEISVFNNGVPYPVTGSVSARFIRADGTTVFFVGSLSGNVVSVTLPQSCYTVSGRFGMVVFVAGSGVTSAVYAVTGTVYRSTTEDVVDPEGAFPSVEEVVAYIDDCIAATAAANAAAADASSAALSGVRTDTASQGLTDTQKSNARTNIDVPSNANLDDVKGAVDYSKLSVWQMASVYDGQVYLECSDGITANTSTGAYFKKYANIIEFNYPNMTYSNLRFPLTGTLSSGSSSNPTYSNRPGWFVDDIPDFVVGHEYKFNATMIGGSMTDGAELSAFLLRRKDDTLSENIAIGGSWVCTIKPEMVGINFRTGSYNKATWFVYVVDMTEANSVPNMFAETFANDKAYSAGDYVYNAGSLYRFIANHAAGDWIGTDATAVAIGDDVASLKIAVEGDVSAIEGDISAIEDDISSLKEDVFLLDEQLPIVCDSFVKGTQIQRYYVGQVVYITEDSTNVRTVNSTPVYFTRRTFLPTLADYEFSATIITSKTDYTVTAHTTYITHMWFEKGVYVLFQVRRTDREALTDADMAVINSWINFQKKEFSIEDLKRVSAARKTFYTGSGIYHGNNHGLFTIAHLTDIHTDVIRYKNYRQFVDENAAIIDCAICTGDYVDGQKDEQWEAINAVTGKKEILQVVGNHDAGHQAGDTLIGDTELLEKFDMNTSTGKMYYYVDYAGDMRVIVLNQFEGSTKGTYVYNAEEITWLLSVLDDSVTNGKHVIIACHIPDTLPVQNNKGFYQRYNRYNQTSAMNSGIEAVIDAFKDGTSVSTTLTNDIAVNHTFSAPGDFLCWLCGHFHGDFIGYSATYPDQLYLLGNIGAAYPYPFKSSHMGETNSDLARIEGTPSEDCFNVYAFDLYTRVVKVARVGANVNDIMIDRKAAVFPLDGE